MSPWYSPGHCFWPWSSVLILCLESFLASLGHNCQPVWIEYAHTSFISFSVKEEEVSVPSVQANPQRCCRDRRAARAVLTHNDIQNQCLATRPRPVTTNQDRESGYLHKTFLCKLSQVSWLPNTLVLSRLRRLLTHLLSDFGLLSWPQPWFPGFCFLAVLLSSFASSHIITTSHPPVANLLISLGWNCLVSCSTIARLFSLLNW